MAGFSRSRQLSVGHAASGAQATAGQAFQSPLHRGTLFNQPPDSASVVTSKPPIRGRVKTGQRSSSGTKLFYPAYSRSGKWEMIHEVPHKALHSPYAPCP